MGTMPYDAARASPSKICGTGKQQIRQLPNSKKLPKTDRTVAVVMFFAAFLDIATGSTEAAPVHGKAEIDSSADLDALVIGSRFLTLERCQSLNLNH